MLEALFHAADRIHEEKDAAEINRGLLQNITEGELSGACKCFSLVKYEETRKMGVFRKKVATRKKGKDTLTDTLQATFITRIQEKGCARRNLPIWLPALNENLGGGGFATAWRTLEKQMAKALRVLSDRLQNCLNTGIGDLIHLALRYG